ARPTGARRRLALRLRPRAYARRALFHPTTRGRVMMHRLVALFAALFALVACASPAAAERIIPTLSNHRVQVSSSFTGDELVLFGSIERMPGDPQRRGGYDVIATVTGPRQNLVTYRRGRVLGIWVNVDSRVFENAPAFLAVL